MEMVEIKAITAYFYDSFLDPKRIGLKPGPMFNTRSQYIG